MAPEKINRENKAETPKPVIIETWKESGPVAMPVPITLLPDGKFRATITLKDISVNADGQDPYEATNAALNLLVYQAPKEVWVIKEYEA